MANFSIKTDLLKLAGAFVTNLKGKNATKQCLVIPVEDAALFVGKNGVYLNLTAIEMREVRYGDTHCVKQSLYKDRYDALSEEERKALPILGGMHQLESRQQTMEVKTTMDASNFADDDDLPF